MIKKLVLTAMIVLLSGMGTALPAKDLGSLMDQLEKLNINYQGYCLGMSLNQAQIRTAKSGRIEAPSNDTIKFRDDNLFVVAHKPTLRVLILYETFENASRSLMQKVIGNLYMNFDQPTIMAHDKIVYWAYTQKGKLSSAQFENLKKNNTTPDILAYVKFVSQTPIMGNPKKTSTRQFYYIISSSPVLELLKIDRKANEAS